MHWKQDTTELTSAGGSLSKHRTNHPGQRKPARLVASSVEVIWVLLRPECV